MFRFAGYCENLRVLFAILILLGDIKINALSGPRLQKLFHQSAMSLFRRQVIPRVFLLKILQNNTRIWRQIYVDTENPQNLSKFNSTNWVLYYQYFIWLWEIIIGCLGKNRDKICRGKRKEMKKRWKYSLGRNNVDFIFENLIEKY